MKRAIVLLMLLGLAEPAAAAQPIYFTPDVPTDNPNDPTDVFLPWEVIRYVPASVTPEYRRVLRLPDGTPLDALHRMGRAGRWLFSVETATMLPPGSPVGTVFEPEDVFLYYAFDDPPSYTMFFDGSARGVPRGSNVDAVFLVGGDAGTLVLSFDVPTTIGGVTYEAADLVRYTPAGFGMYFDASASGGGIPDSTNVVGADVCGKSPTGARAVTALTFDVPTDLSPSAGPPTYVPGELAFWDGATYGLLVTFPAWPRSSIIDSISCQGPPGRAYDRTLYPYPIAIDRSSLVAGNLVVRWTGSCASGAWDYGIYEGNLDTLRTGFTHKAKTCTDVGQDLREEITPQNANAYYLVVPNNGADEGSYGVTSAGAERPQPAASSDRCLDPQDTTPCPP